MERFVFVAAITGAILFGAFHFLGGHHLNITIGDGDFDAGPPDEIVELTAARLEPQVFAGASIDIDSAALAVTIIPEDRTDISVEVDNPGHAPMPEIMFDDETLHIDGRLRGRIGDCSEESVELRGYGDVLRSDLPHVTLRVPRTFKLDSSGASVAEIGAAQALEASFSGCGGATIGDVAGLLNLDLSGSGAVRTGAAGQLEVDMAGSGALETGAVTQSAKVDVAGSGEVIIASLAGSLNMDSAGSGNLTINGGAVTTAAIDLAGSGDVNIVAPVEELNVSIVGSGDVDVAGVVGTLNAEIAGSGGVSAQSVTGTVTKQTWGPGEVTIGG